MIKGVIFDFDGTLVDSVKIWAKVDTEFFERKCVAAPDDFVKMIELNTFYQICELVVDYYKWEDDPKDIYAEWLEIARQAYINDVKPKEHIKDYLDKLKLRGLKLGIASASLQELIRPCLSTYGLLDYFDVILTTEEISANKDAPDIYVETAKRLGVNADECVVFEDIVLGIKTALDAGFKTAAVKDQYYPLEKVDVMKKMADYFVEDYETAPLFT